MPDPEDIAHQQKLLTTFRRSLALSLEQQAAYGLLTPQHVVFAIEETRDNIRRIKGILSGWGVPVDNHPNDEPPPKPAASPAGSSLRQTKIKNLQRRLDDLLADHEAANNQLSNALGEVERNRLRRQVEALEQEIAQVEQQLQELQ
jgi:hypothetical protein